MAKTVKMTIGPKRRIERKWARVNRAMTNAQTDAVLYNCDDRATLVRIVGDLTVISMVATQANFEFVINVQPAGVPVSTVAIAEDLDNNEATQTILRVAGTFNSQYDREVYHIDTKGMRKLQEGDQVVLSVVCGVTNDIEIVGDLAVFLKE